MREMPADLNALGQQFQAALAGSNWLAALELADRLIAVVPENPSLLYNKGLVLKSLSRVPEALECFRETLALAPDHHNAQFELAAVLLETGRFDESAELFEDYLTTVPNDIDAVLNLGIAFVQLGRAKAAIPHLQRALSRLDTAAALQWLATAMRDSGKLTEAEELLAQLPAQDMNAQAARLKVLTQGARGRLPLSVHRLQVD